MKINRLRAITDFFVQTFLMIIGGIMCAVAVNSILIPHGFVSGGFTGISMIIFHLLPIIPIGIIYFMINIPVFFLGWRFIGLRFIVYTVWGILIYSLLLLIVKINFPINDKMLAAIVAGGLSGIGVGIMLRSKGSGGGSEILYAIFYKYFHVNLGTGSLILNTLIMIAASFFFPLENILYTIIFIFISSKATNFLFHGLSTREAVLIVSDKWEEILDDLINECKIGVTVIDGKGGYAGMEKKILYSVVNRNNVSRIKRMVLAKDANAFISIIEAADVAGLNIGNQPNWE